MAFKFITVSLIITYLTLSGCTHLRYEKSQKAQLSISIIEQDRIRFSGKGAGAGMMMSSSMGAMGIAIGVAIEGLPLLRFKFHQLSEGR